jgi:hypothetical protein
MKAKVWFHRQYSAERKTVLEEFYSQIPRKAYKYKQPHAGNINLYYW